MLSQFVTERIQFLLGLATSAVSVWFAVWGFRRWFDVDIKLTRREKKARWLAVGIATAVALVPGDPFAYVRLAFGFAGLAFFVWPNLAHHLMCRLSHEPDDERREM